MVSASELEELARRAEVDGTAPRVGAIIDRAGQVLLLERHDSGPRKAPLKLPGATVKRGESLGEALVRGVREETGLVVTEISHHVGDFDYLSPDARPVRRLHFAVTVAAFEPIHLSAHARYVWAPLDGELAVTSSIRAILGAYRNLADH
ncbi:NUDIX hydrolase [Nocardia caishijiensis]|uniref:NUDIX domain-containing protein n=1 Tax=Nocardia caishijiensis TaxID=184756 RepID=A0ABQ6YHS1_9NOCA|nr:NUDIX hydrolase [Nocardia caishijiensis]KAF0845337.1 NUDIX domain-containing protein [Nocardia caishijiensis]